MGSEKWQCLDHPNRVGQLIPQSCHCHRETAVTVPDGLRDWHKRIVRQKRTSTLDAGGAGLVAQQTAIHSTCPAHCSLVLTSLSFELLCTPVSSLNSTSLLLSALVTLAKQPNQQGNPWAKAATPGSCGSLPSASDCIVSNNCTKWFTIITSF